MFLNVSVFDDQRQLGQFVHLALWRELARSAGAGDAKYIDEFATGFDVVGDIARCGVWAAQSEQAKMSIKELGERVSEFRAVVDARVKRRAGGDFPDQAMEAAFKNVKAGVFLGLFFPRCGQQGTQCRRLDGYRAICDRA